MKENSLTKGKKVLTPVTIIDQDEQKKKIFQLIGKMFGNMAESVHINNLSNGGNNYGSSKNIKEDKDSSIKFAGGFKQPSILKNTTINNNNKSSSVQQNQSKYKPIDVFTVYDQFGLINDSIGKKSKSKPKYREDDHSANGKEGGASSLYRIQESQMVDQMRDNRRKQFDQVMSNNYVNIHEYYDIAAQKDRQQTVIHVKSSLDNMTLQNVQAKLQAHRRQLKNIEDQYKSKKGIKVDEVIQEQNLKSFTKTGQNDPYKQYGKTQSQIYSMIKMNQKDDQKQIQMNHLWEEKLKQNPKLMQYNKKYEQYLVQKDAKNIMYSTVRQRLFKWDNFTQPQHSHQKSKKPLSKVSKSKQKLNKIKTQNNKSLQKLQKLQQQQQQGELNLQQSLLSNNKSTTKMNISQILASKDDKFIAKYIFTQVDVDKRGLLSKQELLDFITKNQYIVKSYNIDLKWIYTDLDNFQTKRKGMLNKEELGIFLATFQRVKHPEIKLTEVSSSKGLNGESSNKKSFENLSSTNKKPSPFQIYFAKDLYRFRNLFQKLDLNQDKILKRQQFIQNIYIDPDCSKIVDSVVLRIKIIQKDINYRQIISFILDDYRNQKNEKLKKSKEYITFNRFCQYFQFPQSINLKLLNKKKGSKKQEKYATNQHEVFDIESEYLDTLKDIFDTIPRVYQDYIVTGDFVQQALMDPLVLSFQEEMCRIQSVETDLPIETVRLTLQRMVRQADQYIDWQAAKMFFSRRGRPLDWNGQLIKRKKQIREQKRANSINQVLKQQLIMKNEFQISAKLKAQYQNRHQRPSQQNYTIPQPFKITDQLQKKDNKKKIKQGQAQFNQLSKTFKAKPVNKQILQPKPDLIQGKRASTSTKKLPQYNYENYQNDRIQRALKRAQQQYEQKQRQQQIKQLAKIKANNIGIDLTKGYVQVLKQNQKKKRQLEETGKGKTANKPLTQIQKKLAQRLHPKSKIQEQKKKIDKIKQKFMKAEQATQNAKKQKQNHNIQVQQKQKKQLQQLQKIRKKKQEQQKKRQDAVVKPDQTFKPKIKKKQLSQAQKQAIQRAKQARLQKQQQQLKKRLQIQEQKKRKILDRQLKNPYLDIQQYLENHQHQKIIEKIYQINILDLLIDQQDMRQFNKDHDFQNKDKKERQKYLKGMGNKMKVILSKEEKIINDLKIKEKENIQKQKTKPKETSMISQRGKSDKMKKGMVFNESKSLRRYREIIDGKSPSQVPSEYDRCGDRGDDFGGDGKSQKNIVEEEQDQQNEN